MSLDIAVGLPKESLFILDVKIAAIAPGEGAIANCLGFLKKDALIFRSPRLVSPSMSTLKSFSSSDLINFFFLPCTKLTGGERATSNH